MMSDIPEQDWKYLKGIKNDLLEMLCQRVNDETLRILNDSSSSQHEKFLRLSNNVAEQNRVVADCFDDWRRSNMLIKLLVLRTSIS